MSQKQDAAAVNLFAAARAGKLWIDNFPAAVPSKAAPCLQIDAFSFFLIPRCFDPVACWPSSEVC
jgi:hypothetical protein